MAILSRSSTNWILSLKVLFISIGVLSMAVILKLSVPVVLEFAVSEVPLIWSFVLTCLRPPYLYVVINGIIITIVMSSKFQQKVDELTETVPLVKIPIDARTELAVTTRYDDGVLKNPVECGEMEARVFEVKSMMNASDQEDEDDDFVISRSAWMPPKRRPVDFPTENSFPTEKPLVSVRFGHRRFVKASPEAGKSLGIAKPKRNDTLESTWKTITEGRAMPLARHLKKSDTWETHGRHNNRVPQEQSHQMVKKSETYKDHSNNRVPPRLSLSPSPGKLRKDPSLSQDELNRRVESFIKKFNEEMRLQRQESLNQFQEMVSRGTHYG
ncbi:hypothetical protein HHK36_003766 [Tetracentron sinense]|uniref:DUF4408 domain-containing protein n=1 Tax=Tetracentron sinense TaxID=13715 RepID=A0A834ZPW3_TETSI|nr:hypothetical protein HHK36_003766 [Tetracentron sinense]